MNAQTDQQLLHDYASRRSEAAFAELVRRHVDLVYSAALGEVRDRHLAEDVTQGVFVALARNPRQLRNCGVLSGWLYHTAQNLAANTVRTEVRRHFREQEAAVMNQLRSDQPDTAWEQIAPHIDAALRELSDEDRDSILLRYFERKSAREIGERLGLGEEAAQKRVSRALEKLRAHLAQKGVTSSAAAVGLALTGNAVVAAPSDFVATLVSTSLAGVALKTGGALTFLKWMTMTKLHTAIIGAVVVAGVAAPLAIQQHQTQANLRQENDTLRQSMARLESDAKRPSPIIAAAPAQASSSPSNDEHLELLRLRAEVTRLRGDASASAQLKADPASPAERVAKIKSRLEQMPEKKIPELRFLTDQEWEMSAGRLEKTETDEDYRYEFSLLRQRAKDLFARWLGQALHNYAKANGALSATDLAQLKPYFTPPVHDPNWKSGDPPHYELLAIDDAILQRYQLVQSGKLSDVPRTGFYPPPSNTGDAQLDANDAKANEKNKTNLPWTEPVIVEKAPVDDQFDSLYTVTVWGYSYRSFGRGTGSGSGSFAKAQVGPDGVPELVDPVAAVGRQWGAGGFGGGGPGGGSGSFGGGFGSGGGGSTRGGAGDAISK